MADFDYIWRVNGVGPSEAPINDGPVGISPRNPGSHRRRGEDHEETRDHYGDLIRAARLIQKELAHNHARYRFSVYRAGDRILMDVILLREDGEVASVVTRDITHRRFMRWLQHVDAQEGLMLDSAV